MKAEIKLITPELAKELLKMNVGNRRLKNVKNAYVGQMLNGEWKENGEGIIIDTNGFIKDGQHRLNAVIEANYSYYCPIITEVDPDVMDTIDTGTNRSLTDVLELNGFKETSLLASLSKAVLNTSYGSNGFADQASQRSSKNKYISNGRALQFIRDNKEGIEQLVKTAKNLYNRQKSNGGANVLSAKDIGLTIYVLAGGFDFCKTHIDFINGVTGVEADSNSSTFWIHKKLLHSKLNSLSMNSNWKMNALIKTWNVYSAADMPLKYLRVDINTKEVPNKLNFTTA